MKEQQALKEAKDIIMTPGNTRGRLAETGQKVTGIQSVG